MNGRKKERKRGSIDQLSDRFLTFPFSFSFSSFPSLSLSDIFPSGKKTITHHSASRSHLAFKHISSSLSPPQGTLWTSTPGTNRNIFLLLLQGARGREEIMKSNTSSTTSLIDGDDDDDDRRQRKGGNSKAKGKEKTPQVSYLAFYLLGKFRPLLHLGWDSLSIYNLLSWT